VTAEISSGWSLLTTVLRLAVVVYGVLATLHVIARLLAGDHFSWLYLTNMLAVVLWAPAVPGVLLALLGRAWWPAAVLCLLPAVVWVSIFGPYLVPGRADTEESVGGQPIRVIAWNVRPRDPSTDLAALVAESDPDIVMLEELPGEYEDAVVAAAPELPYHYLAPLAEDGACCGHTAVLSRWPIVSTRTIEGLPTGARTAAVVTLDVNGTRLDVVPLHLASPLSGAGIRDLGVNSRLREAETEVIAADLRAQTNPMLVGGDLNSSMANTPHRLLTDIDLVDLQATSGSLFGTTRRKIRVDWLFARGLESVNAWTGNARNSDHRPVLADVVLPRQGD